MRELEVEGVLQEEEIQEWYLADLVMLACAVSYLEPTYRSDVEEQLRQVGNNTLHILILLNESMALAISDLTNHIKGIKLKPLCKVATLRLPGKQFFSLVEEQLGGVVDEGLVLNERAHGKGRVDASAELGVEVIVGGAEKGGKAVALDDGLLHDVKVGLL